MRIRLIRGLLTGLTLTASLTGCGVQVGKDKKGGAAPTGNSLVAPGSTTGYALGEALHDLVRDELAKSTDPAAPAKLATWNVSRADFIQAVEHALPTTATRNLLGMVNSILPLVDDGTIPGMVGDVAGILELAVDEPGKDTLDALVKLSTSRSPLDRRTVVALAGRLLAYAETESLFRATAELVRTHDGVDELGRPNGERDLVTEFLAFASRKLRATKNPAASVPGRTELADVLLETATVRGATSTAAAWAVHADPAGNPLVRTDPATGTLYAPFVDANRDGVADADSEGRPLDALGQSIDVPAFGRGGARDLEGRALAPDGRLLYDYFDAKQTALAHLLALAGDGFRDNVNGDALALADALLGPRGLRDNGTPFDPTDDFLGYAPDGPVADVLYANLEVAKIPEAAKLLKAVSALLESDPARAERLLVQLVDAMETASKAASNQSSGRALRALLDDLQPLLDEVFETQGSGSASTARVILDVFSKEITRLRSLPRSFAALMKYSDYKNRLVVRPGEQSTMEKVLDLMEESSHCNAPFLGNLAEFYLDLMAGNERRILGIKLSIKTVNGLMSNSFLRNLLCSHISAGNVPALQAFYDSGALDAFTPIVKAFSDRGETRRLLGIMLVLRKHYPMAMRPLEPTNVAVLESGAVERLFDVIKDTNSIAVPGTGEVVADVLADGLARLVDDDRVVLDRVGRRERTLLHLALAATEGLTTKVDATGQRPRFDRLLKNLGKPVTERVVNVNGTPFNPADDYQELKNPYLIPFAAKLLKYVADQMEPDPTLRVQALADAQRQIPTDLGGKDLATGLDLLLELERAPARDEVQRALIVIFTPHPSPQMDVHGALVGLLAGVLQTRSDGVAQAQVARFLGKALDPALGHSRGLVRGFLKVATRDQGSSLHLILARSFDQGPFGNQEAPAETILRILDEMKAAGQAATGGGPLTTAGLERDLRDLVRTLRDPVGPVQRAFDQIRQRRR
ncbi:MAG: hypothetical protein HY722_12360 [Planctomycetes bacterium]|nr:hypothetical protein [Planctomycetota bacterium]